MDLNTILNIMAEYNLTAEELLLVYVTYIAREENGNNITYFNKWFNNGGKDRLRDLFNSLKSKGVILKSYNTDNYVCNDIEFNQNFLKRFFKESGFMGQELFNAYPKVIESNGKIIPLRDPAKKFNSLDEFYFWYSSQIGHNPDKHKEVMDILKWGIDNNYINFTLTNFVGNHQWEMLQELKDDPNRIKIANNICLMDD